MKRAGFERWMTVLACLLVAAGLTASSFWLAPSAAAARLARPVRIHVFAHSDAPEDQQVKQWARLAVLAYLRREAARLAAAPDAEAAAGILAHHREEIRRLVREVLRRAGAPYDVDVSVGSHWFGPRALPGGGTLPAGRYPALVVRLGDGAGRNWWCVAFPTSCFTPEVAADLEQMPPLVREALRSLDGRQLAELRPEVRVALLDWMRTRLAVWRAAMRAAR